MAALSFTGIGIALAGPAGGAIGNAIGSSFDRNLGSSGRARPEPLLQQSNYGSPIPMIYGRTRVGGNILWSSGVDTDRSGSGPHSRRAYSISLAFAVTGRVAQRVARIWADGRIIRDSAGLMSEPMQVRFYTGAEEQRPDALIQSKEGAAAPAFRGISYVVLEGIALAGFGNRVPRFEFEIVADEITYSASVSRDLIQQAGVRTSTSAQNASPLTGYTVASGSSSRDELKKIKLLSCAKVSVHHDIVQLNFGAISASATTIPIEDLDASGSELSAEKLETFLVDGFAEHQFSGLRYSDVDRDYQDVTQQFGSRNSNSHVLLDVEATVTLKAAQALAISRIHSATQVRNLSVKHLCLSYRHLDLHVGDLINLTGENTIFTIQDLSFDSFRILAVAVPMEVVDFAEFNVDGSRSFPNRLGRQGQSRAIVLDLPKLPWELEATPRLMIGVDNEDELFRSVDILSSNDDGNRYDTIGQITDVLINGSANSVLGVGPPNIWDLRNSVDVLFYKPTQLQSASFGETQAGANLVCIGGELLSYTFAEPITDRLYRLSGFLRGRFGTESAISTHVEGEAFTLLEQKSLISHQLSSDHVGAEFRYKAIGSLDPLENTTASAIRFLARSLRPLAPVHLRAKTLDSGELRVSWVRRSLIGVAWIDETDVPLEPTFAGYKVVFSGSINRMEYVAQAEQAELSADRKAWLAIGSSHLRIEIWQIDGRVGLGQVATIIIPF